MAQAKITLTAQNAANPFGLFVVMIYMRFSILVNKGIATNSAPTILLREQRIVIFRGQPIHGPSIETPMPNLFFQRCHTIPMSCTPSTLGQTPLFDVTVPTPLSLFPTALPVTGPTASTTPLLSPLFFRHRGIAYSFRF